MAHVQGEDVTSVVNSGSGLAFVAYPRAVLTMWCPPLWSVLFFLMLLTLGLDSMFAGVENIVSSIVDEFPKLNRYKPGVLVAVCVASFLLGLPLTCQASLGAINITIQTFNFGYNGNIGPFLLISMTPLGE
jgi:solute carrier family 6 amino acid transporter-like protein 5/7/9/14